MKLITPHSRPGKLSMIDGRRAEARRMKEIRSELAQHVGGNPSTTQRMMIARIAMLTLRMELMDKEAMVAGVMSDRNAREYLAWNNTVSKMLRHLGLKGPGARMPTLQEHIAGKAAA